MNMKRNKLTRRDFLKQGALRAAAVVVSARAGLGRSEAPLRVVILGAGLAGLSAGYELTGAGHDVKIAARAVNEAAGREARV